MICNLQLLRAFAALSVVYLHIVSDAGLNLGIGFGNYGVDLFFVISGFTMSYAGNMPAGKFFLRRCIRILPLYWFATLGTFAIAWIAPTMIQSASASLPHLLRSLVFLPYPNRFGMLQPTLALGWTLNYEMYFYFLFTIALIFTLRFAPVVACFFIVLGVAAIRFLSIEDKSVLFYADPIVYEFCLGVIVYYTAKALSRAGPALWLSVPLRSSLVIASIVAAACLPLQEHFGHGERALWAGIPAAALVLAAVLLERKCGLAARNGWVLLLGDSSYVLYLIHPYIVYGAIRLILDPAAMGTGGLALSIVALMLAAALAAICVYVYVERPVLAYLRAKLTPNTPLLAPRPV